MLPRVLLFLFVPLALSLGQRTAPQPSRAPLPVKSESPKWNLQYQYESDKDHLRLIGLTFPSAQRGVAAGTLLGENGKEKHVAVVTNDGGKTWSFVPLKNRPISLFFLDDSIGWLVTDRGIFETLESGRSWRKLKSPKNIFRVYFKDRLHGWALGFQNAFHETTDGGKQWRPVAAANVEGTKPEYTAWQWMEFADNNRGVVVGSARPLRRDEDKLPSWLDPGAAERRPEWPASTLFLETPDGGKTWKSSKASLFGTITRIRFLRSGVGLALFEFRDRFEFPSEVVNLDGKSERTEPCFRRKDRAITDILLASNGVAYIAGVEPPGRLAGLPIPGKVKILMSVSPDRTLWQELSVDYRAVAQRVYLAAQPNGGLWAATDTGIILKLSNSL